MSPAEVAQQEWEATHPPAETVPYWCDGCSFEYDVDEDTQGPECPICEAEGRKL